MYAAEQQQLSLLEAFQRNAEMRRRKNWELEDERLVDNRRDEERREQKERDNADALDALASEAQLASFNERLDHYDTAIVDALTDNQHALDDVNRKMDEMRSQAFALPDGRRVFRTHDGQQVFDENGAKLDRTAIDPDIIGYGKPEWEAFKPQLDARKQLEQDRTKLLEFQSKVDQAREDAAKDGISKNELDAIGAALEKDMPDAVKQKLAKDDPASRYAVPPSALAERPELKEDASPLRKPVAAEPTFAPR